LLGDLGVDGGGVENWSDLDSDFPRMHARRVHTAQRSTAVAVGAPSCHAAVSMKRRRRALTAGDRSS
jgi:hypothetical protein